MKTIGRYAIAALIAVGTTCTIASADTLNFLEGPGHVGGTFFALTNATLSTDGADLFVGNNGTAVNGDFCGLTTLGGGDCATVSTISFNDVISNLLFNTDVFDTGDIVEATIYAGATALSAQTITTATTVDFSPFSGITSLVLDGSAATGAGFTYNTFSFDVAAVPLPAALPLLAVALGALGVTQSRRKTA